MVPGILQLVQTILHLKLFLFCTLFIILKSINFISIRIIHGCNSFEKT